MQKTRLSVFRRVMRFGVCLGVVLCAAPLCAQAPIVAKYRSLYPTPMTAEQKVALLRGVATEVHGGLLVKPDGNNCLGYACDVICFSPTALFDVLQAEGEAAIPTWNATANPRGYACELVTSAPPAPPTVPPPTSAEPTTLAIDYEKIAALIKADGDLTRARVDAPNWLQKILGNRYVQMTLAAIATCVPTKCWQSVTK